MAAKVTQGNSYVVSIETKVGNFNINFCKFAIDRFHQKCIHFTSPETIYKHYRLRKQFYLQAKIQFWLNFTSRFVRRRYLIHYNVRTWVEDMLVLGSLKILTKLIIWCSILHILYWLWLMGHILEFKLIFWSSKKQLTPLVLISEVCDT